ncbi:hypothetical protein D8B26_002921 [Coccidioides posadasii str. Silveira]|uniref:uncharacterized protein n=1 Tax=Coccidioides posadasii (strain RMSCC 757 / Silveira) TaxID=443226 RepID=UPI001BF0EAEA|nr:hypothetical protein D8B26_002921 [Coccidioides posadasii str. Silveira]
MPEPRKSGAWTLVHSEEKLANLHGTSKEAFIHNTLLNSPAKMCARDYARACETHVLVEKIGLYEKSMRV